MKIIYEVRIGMQQPVDYDNEAEARAAIVDGCPVSGYARMTKFVRGTDGRDRSCAMETYAAGVWTGHDISL